MKILVIGSGGREHAIAWRLAQEGHELYAAQGNPGIAQIGKILATSDYLAAANAIQPDLTIVGPEGPLVTGVVDQFRAQGLAIVGPSQAQAQLEASKIFAKDFMQRVGIPTARCARADNFDSAMSSFAKFGYPLVVKADGLASGKGVVIANDRTEAETAIRALGPRLVIEEFLQGEEVSFIVLNDGRTVLPLEATQDHKAVGDGDTGPNTGGMGAYSDGRILSASESEQVLNTIIEPAVRATGFTGFLYAGLMMTEDGPKVLEFNVRLGDPEAQALMHRLSPQTDLADILMRAASSSLGGAALQWNADPSVCVVLAAHGYPGQVRTGDAISGIEACGAQVFQAGTRLGAHGLETAGGRVLGVTASGEDLSAAITNTYRAVEQIHFDGMHYRRDIAHKGLKRWEADTIDPRRRFTGLGT
ncbi:MAG: phosphoribosylamine--glycine ligase [Bryobacteraceae bacterium]|jgi:phosphoribosylamine--glycine ligase